MTSAALVPPLVLAAVLALAAVTKIRNPGSALSSMRLLRLPSWLANETVAKAFPWAELLLAISLLLVPSGLAFVVVAIVSLLLMAIYWLLIARGLTMTPRPSCGCFGAIGSPIRPLTLVRNTVLLTLAGWVVWASTQGGATWSLLRQFGAGDWIWLLASALAAAATGLVIASERPADAPHGPTQGHPSTPYDAPQQHTHPGEIADGGRVEELELDYEREPIPRLLLLEADNNPQTLHELARSKAQLLVWITCGCGRSHTIVQRIPEWRAAMPQIDVRLVSTMAPQHTEAIFSAFEEEWLYDYQSMAYQGLGISGDPAALLLGADGLLAGGPVAGEVEVIEFVADVQDALSEAPLWDDDAEEPAAD